MSEQEQFRAGYVAIVGRPNVGKSTLLNQLVGQKLSITSRKPQTTRQRVSGILTLNDAQLVFVDTPGFQTRYNNALNRGMNRIVTNTFNEVDVVMMVVEALRCTAEDKTLLKLLPATRSTLLVINKIDKLADPQLLLPFIKEMASLHNFAEIVPVSALKGNAIADLASTVSRYLPVHPPLYEADEITELSERFFAAEFIREKLFRLLGEELPYASAVVIERFVLSGAVRHIQATIIVDKPSHKAMIVGARGSRMKEIATLARRDMERMFGAKVYLEVWVKVKRGWSENRQTLTQLGYS